MSPEPACDENMVYYVKHGVGTLTEKTDGSHVYAMRDWSSGMIPVLGTGGREFDSCVAPFFFSFVCAGRYKRTERTTGLTLGPRDHHLLLPKKKLTSPYLQFPSSNDETFVYHPTN